MQPDLPIKDEHAELRTALRLLAARFVDEALSLVQASTQAGAAAPASDAPRGRRPRRSAAGLEELARAVVAIVAQAGPLGVREIAAAVASTPRDLAHPLSLLVERGELVRIGERRGARYRVARKVSAPRKPPSKAKSAPKKAKKAAKKATQKATQKGRARR